MTQTSMREHAVALASMGFRVFKLEVFSKIPAVENWPSVATCDVDQVRRMWTCPVNGEGLDNNIGVLTGAAGGDLMVLDVDRKNGAQGDRSLAYLVDSIELDTRTFTVRTPSGGSHLYLRTKPGEEVRNSVSSRTLGVGLDVRGHHGFVVGPGSETASGRYEVVLEAPIASAPGWLVGQAGRPRQWAPGAPLMAVKGLTLDAQVALERAAKWLVEDAPCAVEGCGGDATTFDIALHLGDLGVSMPMALELMLEWWNTDKALPAWPVEDLERKVRNAYQYRRRLLGVASPEVEFDDVSKEVAQWNKIDRGDAGTNPGSERNRQLKFEWMDQVTPSTENPYLIKGWLDAGMISILYGATGSNKSFVALDMGWHVGAGKAWNGCEVKRGLVFYLAIEGGAGINKRFVALRMKHGTGAHLASVRYHLDLRPGAKDVGLLVHMIRKAEKDFGLNTSLIIVDTLSRAIAGLDENSASDMNAVMRVIEGLSDALQCHVMLIHHSGKEVSRGARGSSALKAAADTEMECIADGPCTGVLTATKQRDIDKMTSIKFVREMIEVGRDKEGKAISSCVIKWKTRAELDFGPVELNDGQSQLMAAFDLLDEGRGVIEADWWAQAQADWKENKHGKWRLKGNSIGTQSGVISVIRLRAIRLSLIKLGVIYKDEQNQWFRARTQS